MLSYFHNLKNKEEINPHLSASVQFRCFSDSSVAKNPPAYAGDVRNVGSVLEWGRSPGEGNGNPLWYSCLEDPMDRETWRAIVHGVTRVGHNLVSKPPPPEQAP